MNTRGFASDNNSGVSPEVIEKLKAVNQGHVVGYGDDPYTLEALNVLKNQFGPDCHPYLVFTGTAANVLSIASMEKPYHSVFCAETAHIQVDECGAPERFTGCKLIPVATKNGKLDPGMLEPHMTGFGFEHHAQPGLISISQPTELGTVYTLAELKALADFAHSQGMLLHVDGARLANAAVSLGVSFREMTSDTGVDLLSFGGTKNGLLAAESVIIFRPEMLAGFKYIRKQAMQLSSKMRFIAAQFLAYFENDLWKKNALHSNRMAQKLFHAVKDIEGVTITQEVQANGVFAIIPGYAIPLLQDAYFFYVWNDKTGEVRWMTSFDSTEEDIDRFAGRLKEILKRD
ncbi:MAG: low specificity L-threonine aldolase [Bacteroidales bacterium]|nr:low specificity L-threonine aldolase [Bacteroidales bacterium]